MWINQFQNGSMFCNCWFTPTGWYLIILGTAYLHTRIWVDSVVVIGSKTRSIKINPSTALFSIVWNYVCIILGPIFPFSFRFHRNKMNRALWKSKCNDPTSNQNFQKHMAARPKNSIPHYIFLIQTDMQIIHSDMLKISQFFAKRMQTQKRLGKNLGMPFNCE